MLLNCVKQSYATQMPKRSGAQIGQGQKQPFCAGKLNLKHIKRSCAQMGFGKKQPFLAGKLNLNRIRRSCAQMGYGQKQPICASKLYLNHIKEGLWQKIAIFARKHKNSSYLLQNFQQNHIFCLIKSFNPVFSIPLHKCVMVKEKLFMPENQ